MRAVKNDAFPLGIVPLLYFITVVYTALNLGGSFIGVPGTVFTGIFVITVLFFFYRTLKFDLHKKTLLQIIVFIPLIILNSMYSIELLNTTVYWIIWLMFIVAIVKVSKELSKVEFRYLLKHVPYILFVAAVLLFIILFPYLGRSLPTKNSLGIISGGALIASFSINKQSHKYFIALVSTYILYQSDSRSSLVFAIGISLMYLAYSVNSRNSPLYFIGIVMALAFQGQLYDLVEQKMLKKELFASNLSEALLSAQKERTDLLKIGWELFKERPYLGYGLKSKYYEGRIVMNGANIHVHNGYLGTLIETGLLITFFVLLTLMRLFFMLFHYLSRYGKTNRAESIWLFFVIFGLIRAYGENYLFFNIGNIFSIVFLMFVIMILNGSWKRLHTA